MLAALAGATTVTVCPSGCNETSIPAALAVSGVTRIELDDGNYTGQLVLPIDIEIVGTSSGPAVLQCTGSIDNQVDVTGARTVLLENVHVRACDARRAIQVAANAELTLDRVEVFGSGSYTGSGGAIWAGAGADVSLRQSILHPMVVSANGGHIYMVPGTGRLDIADSELRGGDAGANGGCIWAHSRYVDIEGSELVGCRAGARGGAVYVNTSDAQHLYQSTRFIDNQAIIEGGHAYFRAGLPGGALDTFEAYDNLFCRGRADRGAGLFVARAWNDVQIRFNRFVDSRPPGQGAAGAIQLEYTGGSAAQHPMIVNNHFLEVRGYTNQAWSGSVIRMGPNAHYTEIVNNLFAKSGDNGPKLIGTTLIDWDGMNTDVRNNLMWSTNGGLHHTLTHTNPVPSANPMLESGSNWLGNCDLNLQPALGSPLVGAGDAAIGVPNVGAYPDLVPGDSDGDGYTDQALGGDDCDDADASVNPGATEVCDGIDNDCNLQVDGDDAAEAISFWLDGDNDSFGDPASEFVACAPQAGTVDNGDDCDDSSALALPGGTEICDGLDNDCNGLTDDEDTPTNPSSWYADSDDDGFGDPGQVTVACDAPTAHVADNTDCDDGEAANYPGNTEVCDTIDNDCDGDADSDAVDRPTWYADSDDDGFGDATVQTAVCAAPEGFVADDTDCDDDDELTYPSAPELCDGVDNDCLGVVDDGLTFATWHPDGDSDTYGAPDGADTRCDDPGDGWVLDGTDCDDASAGVAPNMPELCDGIDQDCNGDIDDTLVFVDWFADTDGDGFGDPGTADNRCDHPGDGWVTVAGDCDDADAHIAPNQPEQCDGIDQDCNGEVDDALVFVDWYVDADGDGFGIPGPANTLCLEPGDGWSRLDSDCDDTAAAVNPDATEVCNQIDDNCDGAIDEHVSDEIWYDGVDQDCDGNDGDADGDGFLAAQVGGPDCDDADASVNPDAEELVDDIDNNCDSKVLVYATGGSGACSQAPGAPLPYLSLLLALLVPRRR